MGVLHGLLWQSHCVFRDAGSEVLQAPSDQGNAMSDAGGHSGRNADRRAGDPAASPAPPAITGLLKALVMPTIMVTTYVSAQHAGVLSTCLVVAAALVTVSTCGRLLRGRGQTTPTHQPRGRGRYRRH